MVWQSLQFLVSLWNDKRPFAPLWRLLKISEQIFNKQSHEEMSLPTDRCEPVAPPARPMFSIITVTYNAASTLPPTLRSVAEQTCGLYEHIIVDGASSDGTIELALKFENPRIRFSSAPDRGIYDAMNKGLADATGDYVIFLNAGDTFHTPETLQQIADEVMANDYPGVVYGQTDLVDADRRRIGPRHLTAPDNLTLQSFSNGMMVCHQAFVALRRITGPFNLNYRFSADYEWCIHVLQHSKRNVLIPEVIIDYLSEGMTTRNRRRSLMERFRIMCYYYGTVPTIMRHFRFALRFLKSK